MLDKSKPATPTAVDLPDPIAVMAGILQNAGNGPAGWLPMIRNFGIVSGGFSRFLAERLKADIKTQHLMLHCKDPSKLFDIQSEFVQTAVAQYSAETGKLVEMTVKLASGGNAEDVP